MSSTSSLLGVENTEASSPINQIFGSGNKISLVKLNDDNFLLWKFQILTALEAYDMENFLESESEPPTKYLTSTGSSSTSATRTPNPEYKESQNESKLISETALPSVNIVTQTTEKGAESYIRTSQNNYHNNHSYNQRGGRGNGRSNSGGRGNRNKPQCQICTKLGHSADSNWYPDSGATNHLTHSLSNLSTGSEYGGGNQIYTANGSGLPITHYGSMSFNSSTLPFKSFTLKNLLHVPSITKNLISVSLFAKDNHVFFEFHPTLCYVKDLDNGQVLLQGLLNDGLYKFTIQPSHKRLHNSDPNTKSVFNTVVPKSNTPLIDLWHRRLGHPHLPTVKAVLKHVDHSSGTTEFL
ncbi:Retrovirus-related Pol polyprotein from transposon TNT 1-94 [Cucumis melo var. makuwa]|uniref:Retrovirus-related Pol polyprotein from transposon TNT 1-94 n=1 Tax=Cucumis melo var. makuwa TaxID=1194695 RepID=A0A5D3D3G2_CUCMM|nr:Retrovirus-related Pol polyprotein from transposon TNT 1-94 [Cucumis melo var. makuwa]TYK18104.1 Retrovirus-related Pol polyprotein from transposon TNT 1-94 [Cucumis melo var. makuwa]